LAKIDEILHFWFGEPGSGNDSYSVRRKLWFVKNPDTDQIIRDRFLPLYEAAASGQFDNWCNTPEGSLALILLLDQFPRNMFRNQPKAFATDEKAREISKGAIAQGFDHHLIPIRRLFIYLPLEHSENLEDQNQSVSLSHQLAEQSPELADCYTYALRHQEVIERFGRFPHRNKILDRETTQSEAEFLKQPGSSF